MSHEHVMNLEYKRVKKGKFRLYESNFKLPDTCKIRTDGAYISYYKKSHPNHGKDNFNFVRFFDTGQLFFGHHVIDWNINEPTDSTFEDFRIKTCWNYGYYKVKNDSVFYETDDGSGNGGIFDNIGLIKQDTFIEKLTMQRGLLGRHRKKRIYRTKTKWHFKESSIELKRMPNW